MRRVVGLAAVVLACAQIAEAEVTTYSDRAAWSAATTGSVQTETLNSFAADTSFIGAVVPLLNMTMTEVNGTGPSDVNFIDVFPFEEDGKRAIDGTTYVLGDVRDGGTRILIQFASPVNGWGADLVSHDPSTLIDVFDQFDNLIGTTASVGDENTFYGFHLGVGLSAARIEITLTAGGFNDRFGMDNLSFAGSAAPPNPVTLTTSLVSSVNAIPTLNDGQAQSLAGKLNGVLALISKQGAAQDKRNLAAVRMLNAFVLEVQTLMNIGSLSSAVGQALIADAASIAALLQ